MIIIKKVAFVEVLNFFDLEHPIADADIFKGNKWARQIILQAEKDFPDSWVYCELNKDDVLNIILPTHPSEDNDIELVDEKGLTVEDVLKKLKTMPDYAAKNPICWRKINYWRQRMFSPIFLSTSPVSASRQKLIDPTKGKLFHLDGLHRLIGWGLSDRFDGLKNAEENKITAYIAGINNQ